MGKKKDLQVEYEKLFGEKPKAALTIDQLEAAIAKGPEPVEELAPVETKVETEAPAPVKAKTKAVGRVKIGSLI